MSVPFELYDFFFSISETKSLSTWYVMLRTSRDLVFAMLFPITNEERLKMFFTFLFCLLDMFSCSS